MAKKKTPLEILKEDYPKSPSIEKIDEFINNKNDLNDFEFNETLNYYVGNMLLNQSETVVKLINKLILDGNTSIEEKLIKNNLSFFGNEYDMKFGGHIKYFNLRNKNYNYVFFVKMYDDMITEIHIREYWDKLDLMDYDNPKVEELSYYMDEIAKNQNNVTALLKLSKLSNEFSNDDIKPTLEQVMKLALVDFNEKDNGYIISVVNENWFPSALRINDIEKLREISLNIKNLF